MQRQTRRPQPAPNTPLLNRLQRMLDTSDRKDQLAGRGLDYAREHGHKRIYLKHTRQRMPQDPPNAPASGPRRARLYARWDQVAGSPPTGRTPQRNAKCARQCCDFLREVGQELLLARGEQARPTLELLEEMAHLQSRFAPTTDALRWLVHRLRACHEGAPPECGQQRARWLSLGELPRRGQAPQQPQAAPHTARTRRGSWQAVKGRQ